MRTSIVLLTCFGNALVRAPPPPGPGEPGEHGGGSPGHPGPGNGGKNVVDLTYALHRPTSFNETGQYYNFSNIRYAAPPLGKLRFADPQLPLQQDRKKINDGSEGYICPQALPSFLATGGSSNTLSPVATGLSGLPESEDCLFLDVIAPSKAFKNRQTGGHHRRWENDRKKLSPVLFNIFGGGFWSGEKAGFYDPRGLIERSEGDFIYVSINYRLGAFGFLSNLKQSPSNNTSPNAGLLDQRLALKWVQKYIHLFGGDSKRVTIIGESAGGVSVNSHIVAYGGAKPEENALFNQAIAQSAGTEPVYPDQASIGANLFFKSAGVTSADEARKLDTKVLQKANKDANAAVPFLVTSFGPNVDGKLIPDLHLRLYNSGRFNKNVNVLVSHNNRETGISVAGQQTTDDQIRTYLKTNLPEATLEIRDYIFNTLYPPLPGKDLPYSTNLQRQQVLRAESTLACPSYFLAKAFEGKTHNEIFSIPPAIHAQDLAYTYYPTTPTLGFYPDRAVQLQKYLSAFIVKGDPNTKGLKQWPIYDGQATALNVTVEGLSLVKDDTTNPRCGWWMKALYRK